MLVERRATTEVDRARVTLAVGRSYQPAYTPSAGRHIDVRHLDVGGREAEQPAALVADDDLAASLERAAEHRRSPSSTSPPASARRIAVLLIGSSTPSARAIKGSGSTSKSCSAPSLRSRSTLPVAVAAEVEVVADDDDLGVEASDEHPLDEGLRRLRGLRLVEGHDDDGVDAGRGEQLELLLGAGEQPWRRLRPNDRRRMAIERDDDARARRALGPFADVGDHRLVTEVHAVVGADRDDGALSRPGRDVEIGDDLHPSEATQAGPPQRHLTRRRRRGRRLATVSATGSGSRQDRRPAWPCRAAPVGRRARERLVDREQRVVARRTPPTARSRPPRQHPTVGDQRRGVVVDVDPVERTHRRLHRQQHAVVGPGRLGERERTDRRPTQAAQVRAPAEQRAEVGGQRADVRARGALDLDRAARADRRSATRRTGRRRPVEAGARSRCPPGPARAVASRRRGWPTPSAGSARSGR